MLNLVVRKVTARLSKVNLARGRLRGGICERGNATFFFNKRNEFDGQLPMSKILRKILHRGVR
jgi:hypothetical protein